MLTSWPVEYEMDSFVILTPLCVADTHKSCCYALILKDKVKMNDVCILSVINQTQDEALNINDNFWAISTLKDDKKLYITCLQVSLYHEDMLPI